MLELNTLKTVIPFLIPMFSAFTCSLILLIGYKDNTSKTEKRLNKLLLVYYLSVMINWFGIQAYFIVPELFVYLNSFIYMAILMMQVVFYHFVFVLTKENESERFSFLHYLLPSLVCGALFIWSFFVPFDIQMSIVKNREMVVPGYEPYRFLFTSKIPVRLVYGVVYASMSIYRLIRYYRAVRIYQEVEDRRSMRWLWLLTAITAIILLMSLSAVLIPRHPIYVSVFAPLTIVLLVLQHVALLYNIMRRNYLLLGNEINIDRRQSHRY